MIGLGRMGGNMTRRLIAGGITVSGFNRHQEASEELASSCGLLVSHSIEQLIEQLPSPKVVWLMLPAGEITATEIEHLSGLLSAGDTLIDGANSWYKDSLIHAKLLGDKGVHFVDVGVSGGIWGRDNGYALMIGGAPEAVTSLEPLFKILAPAEDQGWLHCGPCGSGHFVKMVHNGIEYGMMQAYAEGFALMKEKSEFDLDLAGIAESWRHGSVVRSWLLDLCQNFLSEDQSLENISSHVADSGEGRWTALEAIELGVPAPVMSLALMMRFASQGSSDYGNKMLAMMRKEFGGHALGNE
jgi:6-phosphogluconate dehydrogenase